MPGYDFTNVKCICPSDSSQHRADMQLFGDAVPANVPDNGDAEIYECWECDPARYPLLQANLRDKYVQNVKDVCAQNADHLWTVCSSRPLGGPPMAVYGQVRQSEGFLGASRPPESFWPRVEAGLQALRVTMDREQIRKLLKELINCGMERPGGPEVVDVLNRVIQSTTSTGAGSSFVASLGVLGEVLGLVPRGTAWDGCA